MISPSIAGTLRTAAGWSRVGRRSGGPEPVEHADGLVGQLLARTLDDDRHVPAGEHLPSSTAPASARRAARWR